MGEVRFHGCHDCSGAAVGAALLEALALVLGLVALISLTSELWQRFRGHTARSLLLLCMPEGSRGVAPR
jgi:hypothetical protein